MISIFISIQSSKMDSSMRLSIIKKRILFLSEAQRKCADKPIPKILVMKIQALRLRRVQSCFLRETLIEHSMPIYSTALAK